MADRDVGRSDEPVREHAAESVAPARSAAFGSARFSVSLKASQQVLELVPGQVAVAEALLANRGSFADTLSLEVEGPSAEWVAITQQIVPIDAGQQAVLSLVVALPEGSSARAGVHQVVLRAFSAAKPGEYSESRISWIVRPVVAAQLSISPQQQSDRRQALFTLSITNLGNAPASYILSANDDRQALDIAIDQPIASVEPMRTLHTPLSVRAGQPRLIRTLHTLTVQAEAPGMAPLNAQARLIQAPFVPGWVPIAMLLAVLVLLCGLGQLPGALAGRLPLYGVLVLQPTPTSRPDTAVVANLVAIRADTQRSVENIQATVAVLETSVAAVPTIARRVAQTSVADVPATARRAAQTAVVAQQPTTISRLLTAIVATAEQPAGANGSAATTTSGGPASPPAQGSPGVPAGPAAQASPVPPTQTPTPSQTPTPTITPTPTETPTQTPSVTPTPLPDLAINDVSIAEGNGVAKELTFNVQLLRYSDQPVTVDYATSDGSAHAPADYQSASGTLTFEPNTTLKTISIVITGNTIADGDRTFNITLSNPSLAKIAKAQGVGTIVDDD